MSKSLQGIKTTLNKMQALIDSAWLEIDRLSAPVQNKKQPSKSLRAKISKMGEFPDKKQNPKA